MTQLLRLAFPVAMAQLGFITMGLIDLYAVRSFGAAATGAVGIASSFFYWGMTAGIGVLAGMDFYISTAYGAGRVEDCDRVLVQGAWLATILGIPLVLAMWLCADFLMAFGVQPDVAEKTRPFMQLLSLTILPSFWFSAVRNYMQATSSVWPPFFVLLAANVANFFLNYLFIYGAGPVPAMGFIGSAVATLTVRLLMVVGILIFALQLRKRLRGSAYQPVSWKMDWPQMKQILKLGVPAAGYMLLEVGVFGLSTLLAARLKAEALAAHQIVLNLASTAFMIPLGIGVATSVVVGQCLGRKEFTLAHQMGWRGLVLSTSFMALSGIGMIAFASFWLAPFTEDLAVILIGAQVLKVAAFFQLADGAQTTLAGALRGIGDTRSAFWANLIGHWFFGLPLGLWLCFSLKWGVVGIWMGLALGLFIVASYLLVSWWKLSHSIVKDGEGHLSKYFAASRTS